MPIVAPIAIPRRQMGFARSADESEYPIGWVGLSFLYCPFLGETGLSLVPDISGNGREGTISGVTWQNGAYGSELVFGVGEVDVVPVAGIPTFEDFTILMLYTRSTALSVNYVIGDFVNDNFIRMNSATAVAIKAAASTTTFTHGLTFTTDEYQTAGFRRAGDVFEVFRNGHKGGTSGTRSGTFSPTRLGRDSATNSIEGEVVLFSTWNYALPDAMLWTLGTDPITLVRLRAPVVAVEDTAAAAAVGHDWLSAAIIDRHIADIVRR